VLRWLIDAIVDCHVAAQSLAEAQAYTGERVSHEEMAALMRRPGDDVVAQARDAVRGVRNHIAEQFDRFEEAAERFDAELGREGP
jgi:glutamate/tyrosine decarboxylase-like PLP-dependent enzyme